jgi:Ca-activated chloride channel homolog
MTIGLYRFANPGFFWLLLIVPVLIAWYIWKYHKELPVLKMSSLQPFAGQADSWKQTLRHLLFIFRLIALIFLIIAIARPQSVFDREKVTSEGIDIVIALDISSSMRAMDFSPDRIGAAKKIAQEFITNRKNDRIGLVVFSSESFTQCPITTDHAVLINLIDDLKSGMLEDGTAIGLGLATAVDRLKTSPGKSHVIILLTDGMNNAGFINPVTAADIAKQFNIRVYTVGIGRMGEAPYPVETQYGIQIENRPVEIDEPLLKQIAEITGGNYYRATNNTSLREIYNTIDKLEKARIEISSFRKFTDKFLIFALIAAFLVSLEFILKHTVFRRLP